MYRKTRWVALILLGFAAAGCTAPILQNGQSNPLSNATSLGAEFFRQVLAAILT